MSTAEMNKIIQEMNKTTNAMYPSSDGSTDDFSNFNKIIHTAKNVRTLSGADVGVTITFFILFVAWIVLIVYTAKNTNIENTVNGISQGWYLAGALLAGLGFLTAAVISIIAMMNSAKGFVVSTVEDQKSCSPPWPWISLSLNIVLLGTMIMGTVQLAKRSAKGSGPSKSREELLSQLTAPQLSQLSQLSQLTRV